MLILSRDRLQQKQPQGDVRPSFVKTSFLPELVQHHLFLFRTSCALKIERALGFKVVVQTALLGAGFPGC